jgi:hypothetical protein
MMARSLALAGVTGLATMLLMAPEAQAATDVEIEQARLKGVEFLKGQQQSDGSWEFPSYTTGITALCTLALIENGVPITDSVVDKGYRFVKRQVSEVKNTYEISLSILLLARVGDRQDKAHIRTLGARLLAGQNQYGGWGYSCPVIESTALSDVKKLERQKGAGDNSCTQFGVLGLWVASRYGVPIEDAMTEVAIRFLEGQNEDGGWSYQPPGADKVEARNTTTRNTMTCAGLFSLTVARATRIRQMQKDKTATGGEERGEKATLLADPVYSKGFEKVGQFATGIGNGSTKYFLWSVERLGVLLGLPTLGRADWFAKGADALVKTQRPDGSWSEGKEVCSDASFAILFLRKANLGSDISRLLDGAPEKQFSISSRPDVPRFDTFAEALKAAQAGEIVRVDGNGPFKLSHEVLNRDLTIQAGYGYDPVFEYQIGLDPKGLRYRPDRDVEAQHMLKVTAGTVTLEGLRLQMDPPVTSTPVPWKAVSVTGGTLRMLNCTVSEANKRGATAVMIECPGQTFLRNCVFIGGKSAVEVVSAGKQEVIFENCIVFSNACASVSNNATTKVPADVDVRFYSSCLQGAEAIACTNLKGRLSVESANSLFRCDVLSLGFLPTATTKDGRSWSGRNNVYNLTGWFGAAGKRVATVTDLKSHAKFWNDADKDASVKTIAWLASRKVGQYSHGLNPQDWDLGEKSELGLSLTRYGITANTVGSGEGYSRYREDFRYNEWRKGVSQPELAAATP